MYNLRRSINKDILIIQKRWIVIFSINAPSNTVSKSILRPSLRSSIRPSFYSKSTIDILWEINSSFVSRVYLFFNYSYWLTIFIKITKCILVIVGNNRWHNEIHNISKWIRPYLWPMCIHPLLVESDESHTCLTCIDK